MFGLIKLLAYGLFGYAVYEFVRGMTQAPAGGGGGGGMSQMGGGGGQGRMEHQQSSGSPANMTGGAGEGVSVAAMDRDGGSMQHKVGRGVVAR